MITRFPALSFGPILTRRHPLLRGLVTSRHPLLAHHWLTGPHVVLALVILAAIVGCVLLVNKTRRRGRAAGPQPMLGDLAEPPADFGAHAAAEPNTAVAGQYVGTVVSGESGIAGVDQPFGWRAQDPTHGATPVARLSGRGPARLLVERRGVLIHRGAAPAVYLPATELRGVRLGASALGTAGESCVTLVWEHAHTRLETIFEPELRGDRDRLVYEITTVIREGSPA